VIPFLCSEMCERSHHAEISFVFWFSNRIPSNPSVTSKGSGGKVSTGSIERTSDRGSPMPTFHVEVLSPGHRENKRNSLPDYCFPHK
jgi:hypothetical protein